MSYHNAIFLILAILCCFVLQGCKSQGEFSSETEAGEEFADQEGFDSVLRKSTDGLLSYEIFYGHIVRYSNKRQAVFDDGVELHLYEKGSHRSQILAEQGILDETSENLELRGKVQVYSDNGVKLAAERLLWDSSADSVTSDTFVTIITVARDTIYGLGFGSGKSFNNWVIEKPFGTSQKKLELGISKKREEK